MFNLETMRVLVAIVFLSFMDLVFTRRYGQSPCGHLFSGLWSAVHKLWMTITYPLSDRLVLNHHYYTELRRRQSQTEWKAQVTWSACNFILNGRGPIAMQIDRVVPEAERYQIAFDYLIDELHLNV